MGLEGAGDAGNVKVFPCHFEGVYCIQKRELTNIMTLDVRVVSFLCTIMLRWKIAKIDVELLKLRNNVRYTNRNIQKKL